MWLPFGAPVGDIVQKNKDLRDVHFDHQKSMLHMYSMLAVKFQTLVFQPHLILSPEAFLPNKEVRELILKLCGSWVLCRYITKLLQLLSKLVPRYNIIHKKKQKQHISVFINVVEKHDY